MLGDSGGAQKNVNVAVSSRSPRSRSPSPGRDGTGGGSRERELPGPSVRRAGGERPWRGLWGSSLAQPRPTSTSMHCRRVERPGDRDRGKRRLRVGADGLDPAPGPRAPHPFPQRRAAPQPFRLPHPPELRELLHGTHSLMSATWAEGQGREGRVSGRGRGGRRPAAGPTCSARRLPRPESLLCFVLLNLSVWCCIKSTVRELLPGRSS